MLNLLSRSAATSLISITIVCLLASRSLPCRRMAASGTGTPQQTAHMRHRPLVKVQDCRTPLQEDEMGSMLSLFGAPGDRSALAPAARVPTIPVDIREDDKAIYVTADAPGLGKGDIKVGQG